MSNSIQHRINSYNPKERFIVTVTKHMSFFIYDTKLRIFVGIGTKSSITTVAENHAFQKLFMEGKWYIPYMMYTACSVGETITDFGHLFIAGGAHIHPELASFIQRNMSETPCRSLEEIQNEMNRKSDELKQLEVELSNAKKKERVGKIFRFKNSFLLVMTPDLGYIGIVITSDGKLCDIGFRANPYTLQPAAMHTLENGIPAAEKEIPDLVKKAFSANKELYKLTFPEKF